MKIRINTGQMASVCKTAYGWSADIGTYALASAWNALAAESVVSPRARKEISHCYGTCPVQRAGRINLPYMIAGIEACVTVSSHADYPRAYEMERRLRGTCRERGLDSEEIRLIQNPAVIVPSVTVSMLGYLPEEVPSHETAEASAESRETQTGSQEMPAGSKLTPRRNTGSAGDEIVQVKWLGMEGMLRIADEKESELSQRFAPVFLRQIRSYRTELFAGKELEIARSTGVSAVRQITDGGILAALWDLAKEAGTGLDLDLKQMPVLQETIEVCEQYRLNPYQLASAGSFLMVTGDGGALADALRENQIEASVIGRLTEGNGKVIRNGEDIRHLDRPGPDEIFKIWR